MSTTDSTKVKGLALRTKILDLHDAIDAPDGMMFFLSGIALLDHTRKDHAQVLKDRSGSIDGMRSIYVLSHEFVHWIQCLTTGSVLLNTLEMRRAVAVINRSRKHGVALDEGSVWAVRQLMAEYAERSPNTGWSIWDMLEAHAVVEGCNGAFSSKNVRGYYHFVQTIYPESDSTYRRLIDVYVELFGLELGWKLISEVIWLALNRPSPVESFERFTIQLRAMDAAAFMHTPADALVKALGASNVPSLNEAAKSKFGKDPGFGLIHGTYLEALDQLSTRISRPEMGSHPYLAAKHISIAPPLVVFTDGDHTWNPHYASYTEEHAMALFQITEVVLDTLKPYMPTR